MHTLAPTAVTASADEYQPGPMGDPLPEIRQTVRALLLSSPAFVTLDPPHKRQLAESMVKVCRTAAALIREEIDSVEQAQAWVPVSAMEASATRSANSSRQSPRRPLATAQSAGSEFSGVAAERVAGTTRAILNAVSFPRFVSELINGVFKAIVDANIQQMHSYVELLNNVATSTEGFADANLGPDRARAWLVERYPGSFELVGDVPEEGEQEEGEPLTRDVSVRLRPGASMPSPEALKTDLGLREDETVPGGDPERTLVPLARRALATQRQQMLATLVMLGMQRIVIESGRINASMRFHIDTHSAAQEDKGNTFDFRNQLNAAGSYGFGPWGASASMSNTIGYVSTQKTQTTEEMNTDLDLNSSVELIFKTDYLPLDRMAGTDKVDRIRVNTLNPEAEAKATGDARAAREKRIADSDTARRAGLDKAIAPPSAPPSMPSVSDTVAAAERAREDAAARENRGSVGAGASSGVKGSNAGGVASSDRKSPGGGGASAGSDRSGSGGSGLNRPATSISSTRPDPHTP